MAHVELRHAEVDLDDPVLVEGMPGVGLVGKIATDHLIEELDMDFYASVHCEGLPRIGVYEEGKRSVLPPVRIYVDEANDLLALQSDIPISAEAAEGFSTCVTEWISDNDVLPLYLSGYPHEKSENAPELFGIATGGAADRLDAESIGTPPENGVVSGPTGALLGRASRQDMDSIGLVVEADPQFPDPEAAHVIVQHGINPLADVDVDTQDLVERAEEIRQQKEKLARQMQEAQQEESSQAQPLRMYQ